jgi:hypothetical protein
LSLFQAKRASKIKLPKRMFCSNVPGVLLFAGFVPAFEKSLNRLIPDESEAAARKAKTAISGSVKTIPRFYSADASFSSKSSSTAQDIKRFAVRRVAVKSITRWLPLPSTIPRSMTVIRHMLRQSKRLFRSAPRRLPVVDGFFAQHFETCSRCNKLCAGNRASAVSMTRASKPSGCANGSPPKMLTPSRRI